MTEIIDPLAAGGGLSNIQRRRRWRGPATAVELDDPLSGEFKGMGAMVGRVKAYEARRQALEEAEAWEEAERKARDQAKADRDAEDLARAQAQVLREGAKVSKKVVTTKSGPSYVQTIQDRDAAGNPLLLPKKLGDRVKGNDGNIYTGTADEYGEHRYELDPLATEEEHRKLALAQSRREEADDDVAARNRAVEIEKREQRIARLAPLAKQKWEKSEAYKNLPFDADEAASEGDFATARKAAGEERDKLQEEVNGLKLQGMKEAQAAALRRQKRISDPEVIQGHQRLREMDAAIQQETDRIRGMQNTIGDAGHPAVRKAADKLFQMRAERDQFQADLDQAREADEEDEFQNDLEGEGGQDDTDGGDAAEWGNSGDREENVPEKGEKSAGGQMGIGGGLKKLFEKLYPARSNENSGRISPAAASLTPVGLTKSAVPGNLAQSVPVQNQGEVPRTENPNGLLSLDLSQEGMEKESGLRLSGHGAVDGPAESGADDGVQAPESPAPDSDEEAPLVSLQLSPEEALAKAGLQLGGEDEATRRQSDPLYQANKMAGEFVQARDSAANERHIFHYGSGHVIRDGIERAEETGADYVEGNLENEKGLMGAAGIATDTVSRSVGNVVHIGLGMTTEDIEKKQKADLAYSWIGNLDAADASTAIQKTQEYNQLLALKGDIVKPVRPEVEGYNPLKKGYSLENLQYFYNTLRDTDGGDVFGNRFLKALTGIEVFDGDIDQKDPEQLAKRNALRAHILQVIGEKYPKSNLAASVAGSITQFAVTGMLGELLVARTMMLSKNASVLKAALPAGELAGYAGISTIESFSQNKRPMSFADRYGGIGGDTFSLLVSEKLGDGIGEKIKGLVPVRKGWGNLALRTAVDVGGSTVGSTIGDGSQAFLNGENFSGDVGESLAENFTQEFAGKIIRLATHGRKGLANASSEAVDSHLEKGWKELNSRQDDLNAFFHAVGDGNPDAKAVDNLLPDGFPEDYRKMLERGQKERQVLRQKYGKLLEDPAKEPWEKIKARLELREHLLKLGESVNQTQDRITNAGGVVQEIRSVEEGSRFETIQTQLAFTAGVKQSQGKILTPAERAGLLTAKAGPLVDENGKPVPLARLENGDPVWTPEGILYLKEKAPKTYLQIEDNERTAAEKARAEAAESKPPATVGSAPSATGSVSASEAKTKAENQTNQMAPKEKDSPGKEQRQAEPAPEKTPQPPSKSDPGSAPEPVHIPERVFMIKSGNALKQWEKYRTKKINQSSLSKEEKTRQRAEVGMLVAAQREVIRTGADRPAYLQGVDGKQVISYQWGNPVTFGGQPGTVVGNTLGQVRVKLADGREVTVDPGQVKWRTNDDQKLSDKRREREESHERRKAEQFRKKGSKG